MRTSTLLRDVGGRVARGALGASACGMVAAALDVIWAPQIEPSGGAVAISAYLADTGLVAPLLILAGMLAGAVTLAIDPARAPSPGTLIASLRIWAIGRPADVAAFVPLCTLASFLWITLSAQLARILLSLEVSAPLAGIAVAAGAVALGLLIGLGVLALTPPLRQALATASDGRPAFVDPAVTGALAVAVVGVLFAFGIATGGVSGEGGLLGIWGVFKRPELDLRGISLLFAALVSGFFTPSIARHMRAPLALLLALAPMVLTARSAVALNQQPEIAQAIERGAPLGRTALGLLRRLTDRDRDGSSALFAGGDCNDRSAAIHPLAREIPDNQIDEDCSGSDLSSRAITQAAAAAPAPAPNVKPAVAPDLNLVLITVDTLRADIGYAGYPRPVSPNIDALAARGSVFERAYALASYTGKSVGPMLIGKYGSETHRNWGHFNKFSSEDTFVAERIKRAGIRTLSVQGHRYFGEFGGLSRGFDVVDLSAAPPEGAAWDVDNTATSHRLSDAAIALLNAPENTSGRFFLWVHYLDPHADYLPHDDVPKFGSSQRDLYDGEVAFTDKHVGRLIDAVAKSPWGARTAIIVTSDHGEAFGEHKMYRHGFEVWEELVRVPLVVYVPGASPSRISVRRSLIDLVPTMIDILRVDPPPSPAAPEATDFLSGVSLLNDVFAPPDASPVVRDVLVDMPAGPYNDARRALIHQDQKLIVSNEARFELYDLASDPGEKNNLWKSPAGKAIEPLYAATKSRLREIRVTGPRK